MYSHRICHVLMKKTRNPNSIRVCPSVIGSEPTCSQSAQLALPPDGRVGKLPYAARLSKQREREIHNTNPRALSSGNTLKRRSTS
ncbi:hypothetical protein M758_UG075100 [Ceratodon purpureus]|nr:hypothetical protein M758_UG075100 [Ceratodon purpureus]